MKPYEKVTATVVLENGKRYKYDTSRRNLNKIVKLIREKFNNNLYGILVEYTTSLFEEEIGYNAEWL